LSSEICDVMKSVGCVGVYLYLFKLNRIYCILSLKHSKQHHIGSPTQLYILRKHSIFWNT